MSRDPAVNPQLSDLLQTMINEATSPRGDLEPPPKIVVHGSHNVFSWGGSVYVEEASRRAEERKA